MPQQPLSSGVTCTPGSVPRSENVTVPFSHARDCPSGIVELPAGPVAIAAFALSADPNDRSGREILARMARLILAAVDPSAVASVGPKT